MPAIDRSSAAAPPAAFAAGASTAPDLDEAIEAAASAALQQLGPAPKPQFALLFTHRHNAGLAADLLAKHLSCPIIGCAGYGIVGTRGGSASQPGKLVDVYIADPPQRGVSLLLGRLPGRRLQPFAAAAQAPGPGARHRAGQRISDAGES
ncbi:hypothetical protein ABPG75_008100 [Micractinium tetrahymenae]